MYCFYPIISFNFFFLVKGKGKRSIQFYFIHLLYPFFTTTIYLPILLYPIYLLTYFSHFYYKHLPHVSPYHLSIYYASIIFSTAFNTYLVQQFNTSSNVYFFCYFNMCIPSCFLNQGTNSFSHKGGRNVMIPNHAQPAYLEGRMYRHFLPTYRQYAIRGEA